jgi:hypothetical protein
VPIAVASTNWMMCIAIAHKKRHPSSTDLIKTQQTQHQVLKNLSLSLSLSLSVLTHNSANLLQSGIWEKFRKMENMGQFSIKFRMHFAP